MQRMYSVTIELVRNVSETWSFPISEDTDVAQLEEDLKRNPNILWTKYDADLVMSDDFDEKVTQIVEGFEWQT
jgi:hypothetical protein